MNTPQTQEDPLNAWEALTPEAKGFLMAMCTRYPEIDNFFADGAKKHRNQRERIVALELELAELKKNESVWRRIKRMLT